MFSSSRLVRLLSDWASVEVEASRQDFSERLGEWLGVFDAITLHAAHQSIDAVDEKKPLTALLAKPLALEEEFHRVRTTLVKSITASDAAPASGKQGKNLVPPPEAAAETDEGYAPYHKRYIDQQRQMALRIDALRAYVRQALTKVSPQLGQLASFDTVMDQMLGGREQKLLSSVPVLLERRFKHLRQTQPLGLDPAQQQDVFGQEMQEVLLAELEVRLQPVVGLIEAFSKEVKKQP
ncbi:DUF3348 domain-containing protein [Polaromonas sp. SM01]|uniref:DUF3348 domain-containing protein n=1 Tax=Polaromonas sp. SM01 TaxID=3085630 RepID=UPI002980ED52|nr:DUF3348 domain-containing protein [Polaromonas sp. SM01]MDW5443091.1 DUF3348 domain-containing protein [Polaromonas sp. SM01]